MINKIKVDIFGIWDQVLENKKNCGGCSSSNGSGGCGCSKRNSGIAIKGASQEASGGCSGCGSKKSDPKSVGQQFNELKNFIDSSAVRDFAELNFYDLTKINVLDYDDIRILTEMDYEAPFVIIDGIVRYYGGISIDLIYNDVKELVEDIIA
ncbi:hypothetical protein [Clostridium thermarum]|uniref:hypothetical protein n=1 Tax=Clostridium thermarum TaxID=1716543 RepID=UPI001120FF73|nr:hypothetical protein [Clostridium thermarum]